MESIPMLGSHTQASGTLRLSLNDLIVPNIWYHALKSDGDLGKDPPMYSKKLLNAYAMSGNKSISIAQLQNTIERACDEE